MDPSFQKHYVAGFFDAEGSAVLTGTAQPVLSIYSAELEKILLLQELLDQWSIHSGKYKHADRTVWQLFITGRDNVKMFANQLPIYHPEKKRRVDEILG
ncbi:MAG: LAGLIDADG family homing endonuclease [Candidatus Odinarchaeota archaeon]